MANPKIKAIFFDFMGTCLDWHTGTVKVLPQSLSEDDRSSLAIAWRHSYFDSNNARLAASLPPEDIDTTLYNVLSKVVTEQYPQYSQLFNEETKRACIAAWHSMPSWPDVRPAITRLRELGYEVFVLANGTTRLQLDLCKSSGLSFDMLFSSELIGHIKPDPESYRKVVGLVRVRPEESVQVAAHRNDTRGAKAVGMRTVYVKRWSDDVHEPVEECRSENDAFLKGMEGLCEAIAEL